MIDPTAADTSADFSTDFSGDKTQPSLEILRALSSLSPVKTEHVPPQPELPPPTEYEALTAQLKEKPHNPDGWKRLVELAESSGDLDRVRETYDALLKQYPNTSSAQIAYIGHFINEPEHFGEAEELFRRFLRTSPFVDLWKYYLIYVRRLNTKPANREIIIKSYTFALNHVGQDRESGEIWNDYIQFLKMGETSSTWEEQQKMDALRKVYHNAVQIPLDNVEKLWQELEAFETSLNRITAKKFMADLSPAHMQARATLRQLLKHTMDLYAPSTSTGGRPDLFLPGPPTFDASDRALVGRWKAYLKLEESNPLELEDKDKHTLITRIQGVYRKAVIRMRYFSEIWYMAFAWTSSVGKTDESLVILKAGLEANPTSYILTLAYAEAQELKKEYSEVHGVYTTFLDKLKAEFDAYEQTGSTPLLTQNGHTANGASYSQSAFADPGSNNTSFNSQNSDDKPSKGTEFEERRKEYGLAYILYMRFGRRAEGVKSSRTIFGRARKDKWTPWEVYEAAALMEYHTSDDKAVASRIFEKGLETFAEELDYVVRYLGFLLSINDSSNARALFERVINTFTPEQARPLWERWARYEYQYGDLEAAQKLEKRIAEVYPTDPPIKRFAQRHTYLNIDAIASRDLGFAMARRAGSGTSPPSSQQSGNGGEPPMPTGRALGRSETQQSLISSTGGTPSSQGHKRPPSPDYTLGSRKRDESRGGGPPGLSEYSSGHKRMRPLSPPGGRGADRDRSRDRDRDGHRWGDAPAGGAGRRRYSPPPTTAWERDRDRPPIPVRGGSEREEEKGGHNRAPSVSLPPVLSWFIGQLPAPSMFDGPVFRTDDLMNLFRNAVIPSSSGTRSKSPPPVPPPRGGGRPPPDYGPYQGPGGGRGGRRY